MPTVVNIVKVSGLLAIVAFAYVLNLLGGIGPVAAGYYAKVACSAVYLSGRGLDSVLAEDLAIDHPLGGVMNVRLDSENRVARADLGGFFERLAVHREGLGCTLVTDLDAAELREQAAAFFPVAPSDDSDLIAWPIGDADAAGGLPPGLDQPKLAMAVDAAFYEPDAAQPARTRALLVVYDGRVVAERYAPGITKETPLAGWSMSKSLTNALVGILVGQGRLQLDEPAPVPEWTAVDPRQRITLENLLQMSSGLEFEEDYFDLTADAPMMLFNSFSASEYAARKRLRERPGTSWHYSSGTSNIVAGIIRQAVGGSLAEYWSFPRRALFDRVGMSSVVLEPDPSGTFVGSSYSYAAARDWARIGLLYLNDGVWQGERILPEGWVNYSTTPAPQAPQGNYGAHVWLNAGRPGNPEERRWANLPSDLFYFSGFEGQHVVVIPSRDLVAVRLGCSREPTTWRLERFLQDLLAAVPG
jgi:CubicO group peptidase (beta-lactamase class C family)